MKRIKYLVITLCTIYCLNTQYSFAQDYNSAVGVRLGAGLNASYKQYFTDRIGGEIFAGVMQFPFSVLNGGVFVTYHTTFSQITELNWYVGAGLNFRTGYLGPFFSAFTFGPMGAVGVEYNFKDAPISLGADIAPTLYVLRRDGLATIRMNGGFFARFIIK
jgi:hypothetical protein